MTELTNAIFVWTRRWLTTFDSNLTSKSNVNMFFCSEWTIFNTRYLVIVNCKYGFHWEQTMFTTG